MSSLGESGGGFAAAHDEGKRGGGRSVGAFDGDGEGLGPDALGQGEEHDGSGSVGFRAKESGGDRRAGIWNEPKLVALALRQGAQAAGVLIALDRQERGQGSLSAAQEVVAEFGIPVLAIARLADLLTLTSERPELAEQQPRLQDYRQRYGVT